MKKKKEKTVDTDDGVKKDDEEQSRKFIEAAENIGADESGESFKNAFDKIKKREPDKKANRG